MSDAINPKDATANEVPNAPAVAKKELIPVKTINSGISNNLSRLDLTTKEGMIAFETFAEQYIRSDKSGLKSKADVLSIFCRAQDLGLPFTGCAEHIHVINGKTGIDIHIIKALLSRAACYWDCLKDYQALYEYTDGFNVFNEINLPDYCVRCNKPDDIEELKKDKENADKLFVYPVRYYKDFNGTVYKEYQLNAKFQIVTTKTQAVEVAKEGKVPIYRIPNQPIDYITQYKIYRKVDGHLTSSIGSFTYSEALAAGFFEKDTYKKYSKIMIAHRAFTIAARDIASDLLLGCMETTELKLMNNVPINDNDVVDAEIIVE